MIRVQRENIILFIVNKMHYGMPTYSVQKFNVFFGNMLVPDANFVGFKDLGDGWGEMIIEILFFVINNIYIKSFFQQKICIKYSIWVN